MRSALLIAFLAGPCFQLVLGHSWIACTDYAEKNAAHYDHDKCRGSPRSGNKKAPRGGTFGLDTGFDYHPSDAKPCRPSRNDQTEYDAKNPVAVYYPGQQVVLAHPMKNHGSDVCTNPYIPDNGNFIYRSTKDATTDPTLADFRKNLVADLGVKDMAKPYDEYPKPGYQNAPAFCENTDKALGTYSFNVPNDLEPGRYTFIWLWGFNSAQDLYSTCFEVDIVPTLVDRNMKLLANGFDNTYEPCGGMTSNAGVMGNTNPGCTSDGGSSSSTASSTTKSSTMMSTTPSTTPTTTSTSAPGQVSVQVNAQQQSGEISLPPVEVGTQQRTVVVRWECGVTVNYWSAFVVEEENLPSGGIQHTLVQDGYDLSGGKIYYHASFTEPCDMKVYPPIANLVDEK